MKETSIEKRGKPKENISQIRELPEGHRVQTVNAAEKSAKIRKEKCLFWQNTIIVGFSKSSVSGMTEEEKSPLGSGSDCTGKEVCRDPGLSFQDGGL